MVLSRQLFNWEYQTHCRAGPMLTSSWSAQNILLVLFVCEFFISFGIVLLIFALIFGCLFCFCFSCSLLLSFLREVGKKTS